MVMNLKISSIWRVSPMLIENANYQPSLCSGGKDSVSDRYHLFLTSKYVKNRTSCPCLVTHALFNTRIFFTRNQWKDIVLKVSSFYCDFSIGSFLFGFLNFYVAVRIILKAVLTSFIKYLLLTLFIEHRGLLGRIKKKQSYTI